MPAMFGLEVNYHSVCKYTTRRLLKFPTDRPTISVRFISILSPATVRR